MRLLDTSTALDTFVGGYGPTEHGRWGVLSEHLDLFVRAGGTVRNAASGSGHQWVVIDGRAFPVVCSDIIPVWTEDGPATGRCGANVARHGSCESHAEEREEYLAMDESERAFAERLADADFRN